MTPTSIHWSLYSDTGVNPWVLLAGFVLVLALLQTWLRRERRGRPHWAGRVLPWTLTLVVLAAALLVWRPVLTRTTTWERTSLVLAVVDHTASMDLPLRPATLSAQLDLVTLWDPAATHSRPLAPRQLADAAQAAGEQARTLYADLETLAGAADQGVPPGAAASAALTRYATLRTSVERALTPAAAALPPLLSGPAALGTPEQRQALEAALTALAVATTTWPAAPPADGSTTAATLLPLLPPLAALASATTRIIPLATALQAAADDAYLKASSAALAPALALAAKRTRADLAARVAAALPPLALEVPSNGVADHTDLYAQLATTLTTHRGAVISQVLLVSDGVHHGALTSPLPARLQRDGIQFTAVGIGLAGQVASDVVVRDWQLPRVLRAGRPATLRAELQAPAGAAATLTLTEGDQPLAKVDFTAGAGASTPVALSFTAPAAGRHVLTLTVSSPVDSAAATRSTLIGVTCASREPRLLLVGQVPDWDTAYLSLAAQREELALTQVFTAGETPKRGSLSHAIPGSAQQWGRYRGLLLHGAPFAGFADTDAKDLYTFVAEQGGTLFIFDDLAPGYAQPLAAPFGWTVDAKPVTEPLRLTAALPLLRMANDGPQSARLFAELGAPTGACRVPAQDLVLIASAAGEPVCSLGFYGRGKVIHWGLRGLYRWREFEHAALVDRLLNGLMDELADPLFGESEGAPAPLAVYPPLPAVGQPCTLIAAPAAPAPPPATLKVDGHDLAASGAAAHNRALFAATPASATLEVSVPGGATQRLTTHHNAGLELLDTAFNADFLRTLAHDAGGQNLPALDAPAALAKLTPSSYSTRTAEHWRPGSATLLLVVLVLATAVHWIFRKLAGLAI